MREPEKFVESMDWLHSAASSATGFEDFGPPTYLEGLTVLLTALDSDGRVPSERRPLVLGMLTAVLIARLYAQEGWRRHPECLSTKITRPLIVTGIPRTGTTALHKLLALDPQFQGVERWLSATPMPRPTRDSWTDIPEFNACTAGLAAFLSAMPGFADSHDMTADTVDECLEILKQEFVSNFFPSQLDISDYRQWWYGQNESQAYRRYRDMLRLIGSNDPDKRWLLKNPGHLWGIDDLLDIFPDALIVHTHRDPAKALPSVCRLLEMPQRLYLGDNAVTTDIGPAEAEKWRLAVDRMDTARIRSPGNFHDVSHSEFRRDPIGTLRGIYQRFELDLTTDTENLMRHWLINQPPEQTQSHNPPPETYGLTANGIREQFADYIQTHLSEE